MPKFGELLPTDVWAASARTLTDFSAEDIFDLPSLDNTYNYAVPATSVSADTFGAWAEIVANVGVGKRLIAVVVRNDAAVSPAIIQFEIGEGAAAAEAAITRFTAVLGAAASASHVVYLWRSLTDNARLSVRAKCSDGASRTFVVTPHIA